MPSDKPLSRPDPFTQAANGQTAGSYLTDGQWNVGGWSTYPSADAVALSSERRMPTPDARDTHR